jgi:hypothetical protein
MSDLGCRPVNRFTVPPEYPLTKEEIQNTDPDAQPDTSGNEFAMTQQENSL